MSNLIETIISEMELSSKVKINFFLEIIILNLSIFGRFDFLNMARFGKYSEKSYHNNFKRGFPFFIFNLIHIKLQKFQELILVADASFIPKSGKKSSLANRVDFYLSHFLSNAEALLKLSKYIAYDGFAYKFSFIDTLCKAGFEVVSKARKDSNLKYLYDKEIKKGVGRKNKYGDKINLKSPKLEKFNEDYISSEFTLYSLVVFSVALKRKIKMVYVLNNKTNHYAILFSTDLKLSGIKIFTYYKARFQIEFLFRDAKQYTGLTHSQSKDEKKLNYHFNTSLTALSLAKTIFYQDENNRNKPFSMRNIKANYYNKLVAEFILYNSVFSLTSIKINQLFHKLKSFGKIIPKKDRKQTVKEYFSDVKQT